MIFNKGFLLIFIRVVLIVGATIGLVYSYLETELSITPYMFGGLIVIFSLELTWRLHMQERNWASFLHSIKYGDFNRTYQNKTNSKELQGAYDLITESMETLQTNREAEFRLLQTVLRHVSVAVICYDDEGKVSFTNKAFDLLLELPGLINLDRIKEEFPKIHQVMISKERMPAEWIDHNNGQKLFVKTESFKLKGKSLKLASLADIRSSLDAKELDSYQKLMRVMTHEIMNSTTPILSLIKVVNKKLIQDDELISLDTKDQKNMATSLRAIEERTSGMLKFVEAYKQINRPIEPHLETIDSKVLIESVASLMDTEEKVKFIVENNYSGKLHIDRALMTQVLINLIKNAKEAVEVANDPSVWLRLYSEAGHTIIQVEDNGPGVPENAISEIFVPFYTTKAEGSGIGLALSRKIVKAHDGVLEYNRLGQVTQLSITLPQKK